MASLLTLGGTCEYFRDRVTATLLREREAILNHYWLHPDSLLQHLTWNRAVISGEAALAFVLRDHAVLTDALDICVSSFYAPELVGWFDVNRGLTRLGGDTISPNTYVSRPTAYVFRTSHNRLIRVLTSDTQSSFAPMSTYPTTALFNYFDEFSFGCAYPDLTMNGRALVPKLRMLHGEALQRVDSIATRGRFQQSEWAAAIAFPPRPFVLRNIFAAWGATHIELTNTTCLRDSFQCPGQSRFFGDPGSLVEFFAPHLTDQAIMAHWSYPPYGTTTLWRMPSVECDNACVCGDYMMRDDFSQPSNIIHPLSYGPFTMGVRGRIILGESAHQRVCNSIPDDILIRNPDE